MDTYTFSRNFVAFHEGLIAALILWLRMVRHFLALGNEEVAFYLLHMNGNCIEHWQEFLTATEEMDVFLLV